MRRALLPLTALAALLLPRPATAAPSVAATLVAEPPTIDGRLHEGAWRLATPITEFVQRRPSSGAPPDQRSELRVLYMHDTIFIGVRMQDTQAGQIRRGLGSRDAPPDSDRVTIYIDPLRTGSRGYYFQINPSSVLADGTIYGETSLDGSWDGVWSGAATVDERGWSAELRVPLTSIAFRDEGVQSWGICVERYVQRTKETSIWPAIPKDSNTFVSRFAELRDLRELRRKASLRLQPYASLDLQLARAEGSLRRGQRARPDGGLDLRLAHGGELTLTATFNPDFGQVEEDPAVVNLGPTETYFSERRPFFSTDMEIFRTPILLLHTRRIGAPPTPPTALAGGTIVEVDPRARIAGAAKLTGEIGPASYGLLAALVLPTHAVERLPDGVDAERDATVGAHYGAGRLRLRLGTSSSLGLLLTAMTRLSASDAYAGGLDWDLRATSGWQATGQLTGAVAEPGAGYGLYARAGQLGAPRWRAWIEAESFSPRYDINDVGYQWRNNMVQLRAFAQWRLVAPWRALRDANATLWGQYGFAHDRPSLSFERRTELYGWAQLRGLWELWAGSGVRFFTEDDLETRGGPAYGRPASVYGYVGGTTDSSRRLSTAGTALASWERGSVAVSLDDSVYLALKDRLTLTLYVRALLQRGGLRWVETADGAREHVLFGDLSRDELELRLSGTLALHRLVTLTLFGQLLHSAGRYSRYEELFLLYDGRTTLDQTDLDPNADFARLSLIVNAALRWDLGDGTAAHLVYKLDGALSTSGRPAGFDLGGAVAELGLRRQTHLLLLKVSYGWNL